MELRLPLELVRKIVEALEQGGTHEIGGILMGEHVGQDIFRVGDVTIQRHGGGFATFLRVVQDIIGPLRRFFQATNHDYTHFNYLGEWHSHPSFVPVPSSTDRQTMRDLIDDDKVGANFVVLMIVKLSADGQLEGTVTVFQLGGLEYTGEIIQETVV
jgi:proteasome lid subunit RPN8/RPN11